MRKQILLLTYLLFTITYVIAQSNIPTTTTGPAWATAKPLPSYYPSPSTNYLRTLVPVMPTADSGRVTFNAYADSVNISTQYFDALNRPLQTVIKQASPNKHDYVSIDVYDEFGRITTAYLPYVQQISNTNDGKFKLNQFINDSSFYKTTFPNEQINYSQATYDASPLQRVLKSSAPGNSWTGAGVGISNSWRSNTTSDSVRLWTIAISSEDDIPTTTSTYIAGSLSIQETTDERGVKMVLYKDELGRTILTKSQISTSPTSGHYGWLCTYYVYDEMNHLRVVIPPKAVDALNNSTVNWNLTSYPAIKNGLCFSYFYDARGRTIMKYIPGKGKNYFAYDLYDRIVMTQDPNLRQTNQWAFVKYDAQSRPFRSGVITSALIKDTIIAQAARNTDYPTVTGTYTITSETYFDDYTWISGGAPNSTLVTTYINSTNFNTSYNTYPDYAQPITVSNRIRGAVTGSKRIILNTSNYLYSVPLYDDHGRVIQIKETNYTGGTDVLTKQYSFVGRTLRTHLQQQKSGTNAQTHTLLTKYSYDHVGRIKTIIKNIDGLGDKTIATNSYNELGQLQSKVLGSGIDSMAYAYNIRGWLTSINKSYVDTYNSATNYFGEDLYYDYGFTNNQLNGAIAGVKWKAGGDTIARAYGFAYDNANRLTKADFSQNIRNTTTWTNSSVDYTVSNLTYDGGGNILSMNQRGLLIGSSATIDSLNYTYFSNSNQLQKVGDAAMATTGLGDFQDTTLTGDDYTYDVNGNITKDYNRHMHTTANGNGAVYNLLDKPDSMVIANKATLYYYYDAAGTKLRKQVNDYSTGSAVIKNYLYIDGFVYMNDTLQYVQQEEGRIRWATDNGRQSFVYDYYLRDHLGNVRTVLTEEKDTALYPPASMETANLATERLYYSGVDTGRINKSTVSGYPADTYTSPNDYIQQLSGSGFKIGTGIVLKVMRGDQFNIRVSSWYNNGGNSPGTPVSILSNLISALCGGVGGMTGVHGGVTTTQLQNSNVFSPGATNFLNNRSYNSAIPKAYLNWILFDDQFKMVGNGSGAQQVGANVTFDVMAQSGITAGKNGFLYVYVSNETPNINVYFDNLQVTHIKGPLLQEQSYYPFGLQMAGISDKALGKLDSKNKFNGGVELEEDYGVNLYSTFYREYDPQIGRFNGVDILSERSAGVSTYQFGINNPISFNDPMGNEAVQQDYSAQWDEILNNLWDGADGLGGGYGGTWSPSGGGGGGGTYSYFGSDAEAFTAGGNCLDHFNGWGSNGSATSFGAAQNAYYTNGGNDPNVGKLYPTVYIQGYYKNGNLNITNQADFEAQLARNAGMPFNTDGTGSQMGANSWSSNANLGLGAFTTSWGSKQELINYAAKFDASINDLKYVKGVKVVSRGLFYVQAGVSIFQTGYAFANNDPNKWEVAGKSALDVTMAYIGTFGGPVGWAVSGAYFIGDATGINSTIANGVQRGVEMSLEVGYDPSMAMQ
jgi:RHS repeat-associated protein